MSKDYYGSLGVNKTATQEEIKKAFRKKAHEYHPDKKTGNEDKFKEVNEAYQVLGDENKRKQYDQFGSSFQNGQAGGGFNGFGGFGDTNGFNVNVEDFGDMFGDIGDMFFGGSRRRKKTGPSRGGDIQFLIDIDFIDAVFGMEKEIKFNKKVKCDHCKGNCAEPGSSIETCRVCGGSGHETKVQRTILGNMQVQTTCSSCGGEGKTYTQKCKKCSGTGICDEDVKLKVKIPAGINQGEVIRLSGQGEAGEKGGVNGDLYLKIKINPDKRFERDGYDIKSKTDINFKQAALGDKVEVETVDGNVKLKIPAGTQPETIFKIKGRGVTKLRGGGRGDHFVKVSIRVPKSLNRKQKKLIEDLDV